jgi:prepilin-type N-terminal cleavage/methylation domain-containing protein
VAEEPVRTGQAKSAVREAIRTDSFAAGFTLIEVMVATAILLVALVSLAPLFVTAVRDNLTARTATDTVVLAAQKLEELRGLTWGFDAQGLAVSDPALNASPSDSLESNSAGFVDYVDRFGRRLEGGAAAPADALYVRRWAITPMPQDPSNTIVIQVLVTWVGRGNGARRAADRARITTVRTRKPL